MHCEINENCRLKLLSHIFFCNHLRLHPLQSNSDIRKIQRTKCSENCYCFSNIFIISGFQVKVVMEGKREQIEGLSTRPIVVELNELLQYFSLASPL